MIGVDIVAVSRIERAMERFGEKFLHRYLRDEEVNMVRSAQTAAGFWAAKEAVAKALETGIGGALCFHDIRLYKKPGGAPAFELPVPLLKRFCIRDTSLSIAHDGGFAVAVAAIERVNDSHSSCR